MALIRSIHCNRCGFRLLWGTGATAYVRAEPGRLRRLLGLPGKKIMIKEPAVAGKSKNLNGIEFWERLASGNTVYFCGFLCRNCLKVSQMNVNEDPTCRKCGGTDVTSVFEMIGQPCPKCGKGVIEQKILGIT